MADEKQVFLLDLDIKEFTEKALSAKGMVQKIGDAENISGLLEGLSSASIAIGVVGVAALALKTTFDLTLDGERIQKVNRLFDQMAESVGVVGSVLKEDLIKATHGLAEETEVLNAANKAMLSLGENASKIPEIMNLARRMTNAFGGDVVEKFESLNTAIASGSQRMLRMNGIFIDTHKVLQDYAKSHGLLVDELNQEGKQQAILNAVLDQGREKFKGADESNKSLTVTYKQFKVALMEFKDAIAEVISKSTILSKLFSSLTGSIVGWTEAIGDATGKNSKLQITIRDTTRELERLNVELLKAQNGSGEYIQVWENGTLQFVKRTEAISKMTGEIERLEKTLGDATKADQRSKQGDNQKKLAEEERAQQEQRISDDIKVKNNKLKMEEEILHIKQQNNHRSFELAKDETELNTAEIEERENLEKEFSLRKEKLDLERKEGKLRSDAEYNQMVELMELEHQQRLEEIEDPARKEANQNKMLDNYLKKSNNTFDGIGRAAEVSAKRASMAMNNFGKQGTMVVNTIQKRGSEAFMAFGKAVIDHSQSASQIMKGFFLNTLADIAQSQGELYLAMGLVDPSKLAAGAALLVLSGALRAMAGSAGGSSGGSGYDAGSGGAGGYQAANSQGQEKVQQAEKKSVNVQIMGNYFETEQTKTRLLEMIRESTDATDFKYQQIGGQ